MHQFRILYLYFMKILSTFICFLICFCASAQKQNAITKDSAFANVKRLFEERPFVIAGAVYKLYDMSLKGCTLEYKIHFLDQDSVKNKISVHRSYIVNVSQLGPSYTKTLITRTSWLILKANPGTAIIENILPDPKKKVIAKPVKVQNVSTAFLPIEYNEKKYETAFNTLISLCRGR